MYYTNEKIKKIEILTNKIFESLPNFRINTLDRKHTKIHYKRRIIQRRPVLSDKLYLFINKTSGYSFSIAYYNFENEEVFSIVCMNNGQVFSKNFNFEDTVLLLKNFIRFIEVEEFDMEKFINVFSLEESHKKIQELKDDIIPFLEKEINDLENLKMKDKNIYSEILKNELIINSSEDQEIEWDNLKMTELQDLHKEVNNNLNKVKQVINSKILSYEDNLRKMIL